LIVNYPYAGFWRRFGGWVIDLFVVFVILILIAVIPMRLLPGSPRGSLGAWSLITDLIVPWLYYAGMESSALQATVGKLAVGVKVTDIQGHRISFLRATGRYFAHIVSALTLCIGYAMVVFTRKRQALHDMMAGTLVVLRSYSEEQVAAAGPAPEVSGWVTAGAILGVLFFGPFGAGVLAGIFVPAYQDYTIRAQVAEGLVAAAPYKVAVNEAFATGKPLSTLTTEQLGLSTSAGSHIVQSIEVTSGVIVITYGDRANATIAGKKLLLIPATTGDPENLVWICGRHPAPEGVTGPRADVDLSTTVPDRNLPMLCRSR
jgi:uncharacterized RDD family membrane protein YckC/Tfp pilus assembly major pilin PilA